MSDFRRRPLVGRGPFSSRVSARWLRALAVTTGVAAILATACGPGGGAEWRGRVFPGPIEKPDFVLTDVTDVTDGTGAPFDFRARTEGRVALLFFGYTWCPDICPVHMATLATVLPRLPAEVAAAVDVIFVTTDPDRDTPERLREWLAGFDPGFVGLRGSTEEVNAIESALFLPQSVIQPSDQPGDYLVGHAAQVVAFGPDGPARIYYPWGTSAEDWVADLPRLVAGELPVPPR